MKRAPWWQLGVLVVLAGVAVAVGLDAVRETRQIRAAGAVCDAATAGDVDLALALWSRTSGGAGPAQGAASCLCAALLENGDGERCAAALEKVLAEPAAEGWLPPPELVVTVAGERLRRGDLVGAATMARDGALRYPESEPLLRLELMVRSLVEDRAAVLEDLEARLDVEASGPADRRVRFAEQRMKLGDPGRALALLGESPPLLDAARVDTALRDRWFVLRSLALADLGRGAELRQTMRDWEQAGASPATVMAHYALRLSLAQLQDPERDLVDLMREVVARQDEIDDQPLLRDVYYRFVRLLTVTGHHEEALARWDEAAARFDDWPTAASREDILRSASQAALGEERLLRTTGGLRFVAGDARGGDALLLSPDPAEPKDRGFESLPFGSGAPVEVVRSLGTFPQRWIVADEAGRTVASGTVWPLPDSTVEVRVERRLREAW